jgi:hypothetical protein
MADNTGGPDEPSAGCTAAVADRGSGMRVELLQYEGCPLAPAAHRLVRECLIAVGIPDPALVRVGEYPSPTMLVNGTDVMGAAAELSKARVCRVDVPTRERVLAALRATLAAESQDQVQSFPRNQRLDPPP